MCEKCVGFRDTSKSLNLPANPSGGQNPLQLAEAAIENVGDLKFWREQTPIELEFGDIERVARDVSDSEVAIAAAAATPLRSAVREIVSAALAAVKANDIGKAAAIPKPSAEELAKALKAANGQAIETGKRQVLDQYRKQRGDKLALPPRLKPKLVGKFIAGKSVVQAETLINESIAAAQKMALTQIGRGIADPVTLETFVTAAAEALLKTMARDDAREANGMGRRIAAEDTAADIESVVYTAIMDSGVCEECEALDGNEYGPDELGQAPNPNCLGALYAGCRCAEVIIYKKG